jgi:hypothetical protein
MGVFVLGAYLGAHLRSGSTVLWPYFISGLVVPFLSLKALRFVKRSEMVGLLIMVTVTAIGVGCAPDARSYLGERMKGLLYLCYSLWVAYVFYALLRGADRKRVARWAGILAVAIIVGSLLEDYAGLRAMSDMFRHVAFDPDLLYENQLRDIALFGQVRPKLFTEEPSYVALAFLLATFVWFGLTQTRLRHVTLMALTATAFFLIRSPIVLLTLPGAVVTELLLSSPGRWMSVTRRVRRRVRIALLGAATIVGLGIAGGTVLKARWERVREGRDLSTLIRIVGPVVIAKDVITEYPLWGVGVTGKELLRREVTRVFGGLGFQVYDTNKIINATWLFVIYYGVLGGLLFGVGFLALMRGLERRYQVGSLILVGGFGQAMGAFVGVRFWLFVFMVLLVSWQRSSGEQEMVEAADEPVPVN